MATITYQADVAPHLQRALTYRRQRIQRQRMQRSHTLRVQGYNEEDYDPYRWAKTDHRFKLLLEVAVIVFFAANDTVLSWLKLGRLHRVPTH